MTSTIYVPDIDKWKRHFIRMTEGKTTPNRKGLYLVDSIQSGGKTQVGSKIKVVTPVAHAVELAKSELAQERKDVLTTPRFYKSTSATGIKRKKPPKKKGSPRPKKIKQNPYPVWNR